MAIGLSKSKNLSERNLNLKTALQKLYAPGIEADIELFSLSSSVSSLLFSGETTDPDKQIVGLSSEQLLLLSGTVLKRTKFLTRTYTLTDGNEVSFTDFSLLEGSDPDVYVPIFPRDGSIPRLAIIFGGGGFFITSPTSFESVGLSESILSFVLEGVQLRGKESGASDARATVVFQKQILPGREATYSNGNNVTTVVVTLQDHRLATGDPVYVRVLSGSMEQRSYQEVTVIDENSFSVTQTDPVSQNTEALCVVTPLESVYDFTPDTIARYSIQSITLTDSGSGYILNEPLEVVTDVTTQLQNIVDGSFVYEPVALRKQVGELFFGQPEILKVQKYFYEVRGASSDGFFLYDKELEKYVFLDKNVSREEGGFANDGEDSIAIERSDGVNISNLLQFKFSQSRVYLRDYNPTFFALSGSPVSISGEINSVSDTTQRLRDRMQTAIQNTLRPTAPDSAENILGYRYNSFIGTDVVIWQRVVMRDPDFVLDPGGPTDSDITGSRLKDEVVNFELTTTTGQRRIPGLYIKVGTNYIRAFSSTDKPFLKENFNPKLSGGSSQYALSAEDSLTPVPLTSSDWYAYNVRISDLAQRIHSNGTDGAFYFHRPAPPVSRTIRSASPSVYAVPLFKVI